MSRARETSALTFGAAAALVAGVLSAWLFALPPAGLLVPVVAVGGVATVLGMLVGEWVTQAPPWGAALLGAVLLPAVAVAVLAFVFAADTVQRLTLNRPPHWAELLNPRTWALVMAGAGVLTLVGGIAGIVAHRWAWSAEGS